MMKVNLVTPSTSKMQELTSPSPLSGWTKDEKYDLNLGLKYHGYDFKAIQNRIPNKTEEQIELAINYFKQKLKMKSASNVATPRQRRRKKKILPQVPLTQWAEFLSQIYHFKELQTECATALRIIGDYEAFPHPSTCGGIDFTKLYYYIADAMEGKPLPDDPKAREIFHQCLVECSAMGKTFIPTNELEGILSAFSTDCNNNIPRPTRDGGLAALRYLASQRNYNPLNIPEKYLLHPPKHTDVAENKQAKQT